MPRAARRSLRLLPVLLAAAVLGCTVLPGTAAARCCRDDRAATLHALNAVRARHGVPPLVPDVRLDRAARRHSGEMVLRRYFAHESPGGARFSARIAATGWMRRRGRWYVGETLAWGRGRSAEPAAVVAAWLRSPSHRRVVLSPRYRRVGIGIVRGTPVPGPPGGLTYTADFGSGGPSRRRG
jgi:uncharacterized protein YkwD